MATTRGKGQGGRPSKGDRRYLASRVPESLAQAVYDAADELGITVSDYIADLLAAEHGHRPVSRPVPDQKELAISA
jgi:antitoxin component of RelBE/YafQ-DinJ toxin-antitoxin module